MSKPIVDLHELTHMEVQSHMRPFIVVNMMEHEETRKAVKDLETLVKRSGKLNTHDVVQYFLILVMSMLLLL
jgi:hypothetical protein